MDERLEKMKGVLSDEAFVKEVISAENETAVQKMLSDKGLDVSLEEIEQLKEMIGGVCSGKYSMEMLEKASSGELNEDELEQVAGGISEGAFVAGSSAFMIGFTALALTYFRFEDEIKSGVKTAANWVADNITRW